MRRIGRRSGLCRFTALLLACALLLTACGNKTAATTIHLRKTEGSVAVADDTGRDVALLDNMGLYSGYGVDTKSESYAWINLDDVKLTKMDEDSKIEIQKEDKHLTIEVKSGSLFFNVTEPLEEDETMDIRTSTMMVGIRGTCGWVTQTAAALLEGTVSVTAGEQSVTIHAGEMAIVTADGTLEVVALYDGDIPAFVWEEIGNDETLLAALSEVPNEPESGEEPEADSGDAETDGESVASEAWQLAYLDVLEEIRSRNEALGSNSWERADIYRLYDIDKDGTPELIAGYALGSPNISRMWVYTFRDGAAASVPVDGQESSIINGSWPTFGSYPGGNGVVLSMTMYGNSIYQLWRLEGGVVTVEVLPANTPVSGSSGLEQYDITSDDPILQYSPME